MRLTFRARLLAIAGITTATFLVLIVASALISEQVGRQLGLIEDRYIPKLELGPKLEIEPLRRSFQDAVAAQDADALSGARAIKDELLRTLRSAGSSLEPAQASAARSAVAAYYDAAEDVSRRLIAGETGEALVEAMAGMQAKQVGAEEALRRVAAFDERELGKAFSTAKETQATGGQLRLAVGFGSLALLLLLMLALTRSLMAPVRALVAGFERFGTGDFKAPIDLATRDELGKVAEQANLMARNLAQLARERDESDWLKIGVAGLNDELRGELEPGQVATRAIGFLASYLDAPVAAFYGLGSDGKLRLLGSYAGPGSSEATPSFALGEGLVGQAALGTAVMIVGDLPADYVRVRSGLGAAVPKTAVLAPVVHMASVVGVIELGVFDAWTEARTRLLRSVSEALAITLEVARARVAMRELLHETQRQAQRLTAQEEELRANNEELQAQQEELQAQQDELRVTNEELTQQSDELQAQQRALEASNTELSNARRDLQRHADDLATVSAYKSQFLANMSHELRTPLNSMLLLSNLLAENEAGNLTQKQVDFCSTIHSAGRDLLALINQVLDLAKVEAGRQDVTVVPVKLHDLAAHAERMFGPLARDKGLSFVVELAPDAPAAIETDKRRVEQVMNNLLGNAIKFTERGTITLRVGPADPDARLQRKDLQPDRTLAISVQDTGIGIAAGDQQRVFVPFEQVDASPDRRYGGTGLGLAIGRQLAVLLGGELVLESTAGQGSTFTLFLPYELARPRAVSARPAPDLTSQPRAQHFASTPPPREVVDDRGQLERGEPHLLVVEDDPAFAEALGEVIRGQGFKFVVAGDGQSALELAKKLRPSGIVLDVKLPDVDGFAVMENLRADAATAAIPVHFLSAIDAGERGMALGAVGYLTKPASRRDLVRVVESLAPKARERERRVLIVEPDMNVADSLAERLRDERIEVRRVASARDALLAIEHEALGCLVVDLALPDMDGLDFLRAVREQNPTNAPPVVVYTERALSKLETQRIEAYAEAVVLTDGSGIERLLDEIRLFVRRLRQGLPARQTAPTKQPTSVRLEGRKILLVDDDMRTVYALSAVLRAKGAEVLVADNGRVALEVLAAHPNAEAVLMDIMMPEMDGYEAIKRIRAESRFETLPIIALTAKAMKGDREKCLEIGATDYLPKPVDPDDLATALHRLLSASSSHGG